MLISDIFDITAGQVMSRITDEVNPVEERKVLLPKAISSGRVIENELVNNKMKTILDPTKMTMEGDIIFKLSTPYDCCIIDEKNVGLVVPSFCAILRKRSGMAFNNDYLVAYINSDFFAEQVKRMITGNVIGILSISSLKNLSINDFPVHIQEEIGKEFRKKVENKVLFERMLTLQNEKLEALIAEGALKYGG